MTEAEWLASEDPHAMLAALPRSPERRDLRLFACLCIRRFGGLIEDGRVTRAVEIAERHADRPRDRGRYVADVFRATVAARENAGEGGAAYLLASAAHDAICDYQQLEAYWTPHVKCAAVAALDGGEDARRAETRWQAAALRDVVAGPGSPNTLAPSLLTPTVHSLARAALTARRKTSWRLDNTRLGVLADALEEAGCADARLLAHLRSLGPHYRGCWALDLVRGKR